MKTLVKSRMCRYWETCELPLNEETIQEINELIAMRTKGAAPVVTEEDIVRCYMGEEVAEHLKVKYDYNDCYGYQAPLYSIVSGILDELINEQEIEFSLIDVDYQEDSVI